MNFFNFLYLIMSPMFLISGLFMFFLSFFFFSQNFSILVYWSFYYSSFSINFPFYFDFISCLFMSLVLFISGSIILYSDYYMKHEFYKIRFFFLMFFFVVSMIFLILCPNIFCMLLGWDGLGLISYCLVIYYQNYKSFCSGMITALTNRVGDVFILSCISFFFSFGSFNYMNFLNLKDLGFIGFFFIIAAMTKSAQIPFSAWLPAAMAAPTPVSSLVHSSTLVTAGVYILIRYNFFLTENMKSFLICISLLTMLMSGFSGMFEFDLKKIIALSTLSQLGFMISSICLGYSELAFFHLITHASFKALLFMCAGLFIHSFFDVQDIRLYGFMKSNNYLIMSFFNIANLSLCGFPFLSGFFSKDLILELMMMKMMGYLMFFFYCLGTFLTVFYSFRLFIFLSLKKVFYYQVESNLKSLGVQKSMFLLLFFSVSLGYLGSNLFFFHYNYIVLPFILKIFVSLLCLSSFLLSYYFSYSYWLLNNFFILFFGQMWFLGFLKTDFLKPFSFFFSYVNSKILIGFIESNYGRSSSLLLSSLSFYMNNFLKSSFYMFFIFFLYFILFILFF
uniref:NADH dehydrogenase subunit 5 n=1 Tax=Odontothrips phaseoli TaxID=3078581 RepID=UPI002A82BBE0|nr:NADH dehydrogenase subunit 5 [Odontothrips phaseoli]WOH21584.1 NADH dehydrogenase subunit 5 [Odontothrips phaseoli]